MKFSHLMFWFLMLSGLTAIGVAGWRIVDQPVVSASIDGLLTDQEIQEVQSVVQSVLPQSMLSLDVEKLVAHLEDLTWPDRIHVRRVWPDSLSISISKPSVVARWREGGVLTSRGEIVFMNDPAHAKLPVLSAEIASPAASMNRFEVLNSLLGASSTLRLTGLHQNQLGEWQVELNKRVAFKLGSDDIHARFRRALLVYEVVSGQELANQQSDSTNTPLGGGPDKTKVPTLDARYQNGVAVSWPSTLDQLVAYGQ